MALLQGDFGEGDTIIAQVSDGQIVFHRPGEAEIAEGEWRAL